MPQIESADEARSVARLIREGRITGPNRDTAMQALRVFDAAQSAPPPEPQPNLGAVNMPFIRDIRSGLGQAADFAEKELTPAKVAAGTGETGLAFGSGMVATPVAGLGGLLMNPLSPVGAGVRLAGKVFDFEAPSSADAVEGIQDALTYRPARPLVS
jgi:hypothetical protein